MTTVPTLPQSKPHSIKSAPAWPRGYPHQLGKPGGEGRPQWVLLFLIAACLALLLLGFSGCGISRATQRVLVNEAAFNIVGVTWAKLNPCVVDSVKTLVHDTTITTDTAYLLPQITPRNSTPTGTATVYMHDTILQTVTKTITRHDSVKIVSADKRLLSICNDSVGWYKIQFANYKTNATSQINTWKNKARSRFWLLLGLLALAAFYFFKKPLFAALGGLPKLLAKKI